MRVGLELRIDEVRNLARMPMQLDQVRPLDLAQIRPCAALVNPEQWLERIECRPGGQVFDGPPGMHFSLKTPSVRSKLMRSSPKNC